MHEYPRQDAVRPVAKPRERDAKRDEDDERFEKPVREPERDAGEEDRRRAAKETEQRLTHAAEGELLDERRNHCEEDEIGGESACVRRLPVDVCDPLFFAGRFGERQE